MKKLLLILSAFLLFAFGAEASTVVTATVAITNAVGTTNGQTIIVNADTRTWTNSVFVPASQILTNNTAAGAAAALLNHAAVYPFSSLALGQTSTTNITLRAATDAALTVTLSAGWGTVSYVTNPIGAAIVVRVPLSVESAAQQTNIASAISAALSSSANTNPLPTLNVVTNIAAYQAQLSTNALTWLATLVQLNAATNTTRLATQLAGSFLGLHATADDALNAHSVTGLVASVYLPTNTVTAEGIVTRPTGPNLVYKSDGSSIPGWRADATGGTPSFDAVTSGANTTAAMQVGTGATLAPTGTGTVTANKLTGIKSFIILGSPFRVDGTGCILYTNDSTKSYFGQAQFNNVAAKAGNWCDYFITVPEDIDTSVDLKVERWKFQLSATDTGKHAYKISMLSVADSAAYAGTPSTEIALSFGGDASGAAGDVETVSGVTLTGWKSGVTAGQLWIIRVARDGNDGTLDTSTVDSYSGPLVLSYGVVQ